LQESSTTSANAPNEEREREQAAKENRGVTQQMEAMRIGSQ